jgi:hypothetical protein
LLDAKIVAAEGLFLKEKPSSMTAKTPLQEKLSNSA